MKGQVFYCAFFGEHTCGLPGQQNLSHYIRNALKSHFAFVDLSQNVVEIDRFPSVASIIVALIQLWFYRICWRSNSGSLTVVDMVHSVTVLPKNRFNDRLLFVGHDSYALRAKRDFTYATALHQRLRLGTSVICWNMVEWFIRRVSWKTFFVSSHDLEHAARDCSSDLLAIPVQDCFREFGRKRREGVRKNNSHVQKIVVALPVKNTSQTEIDVHFCKHILQSIGESTEVTLWGKNSSYVESRLGFHSQVQVETWVEDYPEFLASFDLCVYPRMIGSGFHTKLAEALVLGVPCLCVDWVAAALAENGYDGLSTFSCRSDFSVALSKCLKPQDPPVGFSMPRIPHKARPDAALRPLVESCSEAIHVD